MIKDILSEITKLKSSDKISYIHNYLVSKCGGGEIVEYNFGVKNVVYDKRSLNPSEELIIFAHHDISFKTKEGANDNSSSVAVALKLCESLRFTDIDKNIKIVFNDNEELLGALLGGKNDIEFINKIITKVGSFLYLKSLSKTDLKRSVIVLELSGVGDSVFLAESSGFVECDAGLNERVGSAACRLGYKTVKIDVPASDMISVRTVGLPGTVIGAIPFHQAEAYNYDKDKWFPAIFRNIHSDSDNISVINENSLCMINSILLELVSG